MARSTNETNPSLGKKTTGQQSRGPDQSIETLYAAAGRAAAGAQSNRFVSGDERRESDTQPVSGQQGCTR